MRVWQPSKHSVMRGRYCTRAWQRCRVCECVCKSLRVCVGECGAHTTGLLKGEGVVLIGYAWNDFWLALCNMATSISKVDTPMQA